MQSETHGAWPLPTTNRACARTRALALARADMAVFMLHDETVGALFPALAQGISEAKRR